MSADSWLSWIAIGAAASLAGMIWAFRRGVAGVVANIGAGIGGAVLAALLSFAIVPSSASHATEVRLLFAAVGAVAALSIVHGGWTVWLHRPRGRQAPTR
jgi:uncharacterized membrane protein YeaQ/YmgE (transglycosylase-associated protein family)